MSFKLSFFYGFHLPISMFLKKIQDFLQTSMHIFSVVFELTFFEVG